MRQSIKIALIVEVLLGCSRSYAAGPDPLTGVRISLLGVQTTLSSPPIPDLKDSHEGNLEIQAAYMPANVSDSENFGNGITQNTTGSFTGGSIGIGYTTPTNSNLGYYGFLTVNSINGNLKLTQGSNEIDLTGMKNIGVALAGGASLRLWKEDVLPFSVGLFAGPTLSYFKSDFQVASPGAPAGQSASYTSSPFSYGGMAGVQMGFSIYKIYFNPYLIYYQDFTDGCKSFDSTPTTPNQAGGECSEGTDYIKLPLSVLTYGINVGIWQFFLTAYSHVKKDASLNSIDLKDYQLSYHFSF